MKRNSKPQSPRLRALDLFSGCGGLTEGLKEAGFDVLGAIEIDPIAGETYHLNHPEVHVWKADIKTVKGTAVRRKLKLRKGSLDLLAGCPPCQGFSSMRTLNGNKTVDDPQNSLLMEFLRFVEELRPKAVMMENVPALAEDNRFKAFCDRLAKLGYLGQFRVLDAANYGVPQRRRRLIYMASVRKEIPFAAPDLEAKTVRDAIESLPEPGKTGDAIHDLPEKHSRKVLNRIRAIPQNGGSRTDLPKRKQLPCHKKSTGFKDVYGRMSWDAVAPTITGGCFNPSKGRFLHPTHDRAITMREAALLQGFPGRYKFDAKYGKTATALMIGNALPPPFISAHARSISKVLLSTPRKKTSGRKNHADRHQSSSG